jgi:hypothetical protein
MHIVRDPTQYQADYVITYWILAVFLIIIWNWPDDCQILTETCKFQIYIIVSAWPITGTIFGTLKTQQNWLLTS